MCAMAGKNRSFRKGIASEIAIKKAGQKFLTGFYKVFNLFLFNHVFCKECFHCPVKFKPVFFIMESVTFIVFN